MMPLKVQVRLELELGKAETFGYENLAITVFNSLEATSVSGVAVRYIRSHALEALW